MDIPDLSPANRAHFKGCFYELHYDAATKRKTLTISTPALNVAMDAAREAGAEEAMCGAEYPLSKVSATVPGAGAPLEVLRRYAPSTTANTARRAWIIPEKELGALVAGVRAEGAEEALTAAKGLIHVHLDGLGGGAGGGGSSERKEKPQVSIDLLHAGGSGLVAMAVLAAKEVLFQGTVQLNDNKAAVAFMDAMHHLPGVLVSSQSNAPVADPRKAEAAEPQAPRGFTDEDQSRAAAAVLAVLRRHDYDIPGVADICAGAALRSFAQQPASRPEPPVSPGEILFEEFIKPTGLSVAQASASLDVPTGFLDQLIRGRERIDERLAGRLGVLFKTTPEFWLTLQANYDARSSAPGDPPLKDPINYLAALAQRFMESIPPQGPGERYGNVHILADFLTQVVVVARRLDRKRTPVILPWAPDKRTRSLSEMRFRDGA